MDNYVEFNPNDKNTGEYGDCVIRAIAKALDLTWLEAFDLIVARCREIQCLPTDRIAYKTVLEEHGFVYHGISIKKGMKRPRVSEFAAEHENMAVARVAHHVVPCCNGKYYDFFDSGDMALYGYWIKE